MHGLVSGQQQKYAHAVTENAVSQVEQATERSSRRPARIGSDELIGILHYEDFPAVGAGGTPFPPLIFLTHHVHQVVRVAEELLGVEDEVEVGPPDPLSGESSDGGGLAGPRLPVPQDEPATSFG